MFSTLISATDLAAHLQRVDWLVVDCRSDLLQPTAGEAAYVASHIPGAVYAHLDRDLASAITPSTGRHPLPDPQQFAATLGRWGLQPHTQVVAYDADTGAYAARLWWLLRWVGHRKVAVLDGGFKAWTAAGLPTTQEKTHRIASNYAVAADRSAWLDASQVAANVASNDWRLLDARAPERFAGKVEPIDPVAGHVPGARNHPFALNLTTEGRFLPASELRARFAASQDGVDDRNTIVMCGSGVTACHLLLALEVAGKPGAKLYAGSWSEWIRDSSRGIATEK
ncbi:thiosulfate/3-mercaptopyruvate sulfurtransferase [Povalibacter uvarum]|uniref:Sulfurtransferase n=1 Tax=Povalibacter uvarum TaxID=732238 RepID=A0A841HNX8_9GAMM|nr:sulfurtransferase [Povalibacter uvarum]MBB6094837.1 thiosulfate/3-mercaptopyruvate sulfurtransferase [Povalibacter uvarum]